MPPKLVPKKSTSGPGKQIVALVCVILSTTVVGMFFIIGFSPSSANSSPSVTIQNTGKLSDKISNWMPKDRVLVTSSTDEPDWSKVFWTPIDLDMGSGDDPVVTLCVLNFREYTKSPHLYPMFRDLENLSRCTGTNRKKEKMSVLIADIKKNKNLPEGRVVAPSGFIFHESRVGSTLVANEFACEPFSLVFSESAPGANALTGCSSCSFEKSISVFRDIVTLMGRSPVHTKLFFKFQSITSTKMHIALEAFPDTPWSFVYRSPVQTMMSHLDPSKGSQGAPCLRSKRAPPAQVRDSLKSAGFSENNYASIPTEAWCAAHLNMLCESALAAFEKYGTRISEGKTVQRGMLINYESLPGIIPRVILPMFNIEVTKKWVERMEEESNFYSKNRGRKDKIEFSSDSADKEQRSTGPIQQYAKIILEPTFKKLLDHSMEALERTSTSYFDELNEKSKDLPMLDWSIFKTFPVIESRNLVDKKESNSLKRVGHSQVPVDIPYLPWTPFSNRHESVPFERVKCPPIPEPGYPKHYKMTDITNNWNTDSTEIPPFHYDSICHFDFSNKTEHDIAQTYREAEVPFVVYNVPEVDKTVSRWSDIDYVQKMLGKKTYHTEKSKTNHFMYWAMGANGYLRGGKPWEPPTTYIRETFEHWLELAIKGQNQTLEERNHEYLRVSTEADVQWVFDELSFFRPVKSFFIVEPNMQRGIHCRFGMRSAIAEAHFDGSRNFISLIGGLRRYILSHPRECKNMHMYQRGHPSARHSEIDWSKPDPQQFPNWLKLEGNEVIMQPGDVLYLPTFWLHYIISLNINYQCNTRSGITHHFDKDIRDCGFG